MGTLKSNMAETDRHVESLSKPTEEVVPDVHNTGAKIERAGDAYRLYAGLVDMPSKGEIWVWYLYSLCSYFVLTTLLPVIFPLIIGYIVKPEEPRQGWSKTRRGFVCGLDEMEV